MNIVGPKMNPCERPVSTDGYEENAPLQYRVWNSFDN